MPDPTERLNAALEGRYSIERELGEGGMATVYLAEDLNYGPAATYRLARLRERQGELDEARRHYRSFLELWSRADPDLPPVVAAKEAVSRLGG